MHLNYYCKVFRGLCLLNFTQCQWINQGEMIALAYINDQYLQIGHWIPLLCVDKTGKLKFKKKRIMIIKLKIQLLVVKAIN